MLNAFRSDRQRQLRRLRNEGTGGEMDDSADGAIIVGVAAAERRRSRLRPFPTSGGNRMHGATVVSGIEMNVAEGESKLQRQRRQRQKGAKPPAAANPTH